VASGWPRLAPFARVHGGDRVCGEEQLWKRELEELEKDKRIHWRDGSSYRWIELGLELGGVSTCLLPS